MVTGKVGKSLSETLHFDSALDEVLSKKLLFVTGKGGVGKTTIATALGLLALERGKRVLLCEVEPKGEIGRYFGVKKVGFEPTEVQKGLYVMEMDTEQALSEYLRIYLKIPIPTRIGPLAKAFDFVSNAAPGVREILVVGKLCYEVRRSNYDIIIADASATGHVVSQLASPQGVNELFGVGLVKDQTKWMLDILKNPTKSGICLVSTAEETPVEEAIDLAQRLGAETEVKLTLGVVNKIIPKIFSETEESFFIEMTQGPLRDTLDSEIGVAVEGLVDATSLWQSLARSNQENTTKLKDALKGAVPLVEVPVVPGVSVGIGLIREVAETIEVELA